MLDGRSRKKLISKRNGQHKSLTCIDLVAGEVGREGAVVRGVLLVCGLVTIGHLHKPIGNAVSIVPPRSASVVQIGGSSEKRGRQCTTSRTMAGRSD